MNVSREATSAEAPAKPRKKKSWLKRIAFIFLGLFVVLLVIVGFLPSILSTGSARSFVSGKASTTLGAPVEIDDWSFSWNGTQSIRGFRVGQPSPAKSGAEGEAGTHILAVESLEIRNGLFSFVKGGRDVDVVLEKPVIRVARDADGKFNFDGLGGASEEAPAEEPEPSTEEGGGLPEIPGEVHLKIVEAELHYRDEMEGTASSITGVNLDLDLDPEKLLLALAAKVGHPDAKVGSDGGIQIDAKVDGLSQAASVDELAVEATAELKSIDLAPYAALIERMTGVKPPGKPLEGKFTVTSAAEGLAGTIALDADYAVLRNGTFSVARVSGKPLAVSLPYEFELASLTAALGDLSGVPQGGEVAGKLTGELKLGGPLSLADLKKEKLVLAALGLELGAHAENLKVVLPPAPPEETTSPETASKGGATPEVAAKTEEAAKPAEPFVLDEKTLDFTLKATTGASEDELRLEILRVVAEGLNLDVTGQIDRKPVAEGSEDKLNDVNLTLGADVVVPALVARIASYLPEGISVSDGTRAKLEDLKVVGPIGGEGDPTQLLDVKGGFLLEGGKLEYQGVGIESLRGRLELEKGQAKIADLDAQVNGGRLTAKTLSYELGSDNPSFEIDLSLDKIGMGYGLSKWLSYALPFVGESQSQANLSGLLNAGFKISGKGLTLPELVDNLKGSGKLSVAEGSIASSPFFQKLGSLLSTRFDGIAFKEMGTDFAIDAGKIASKNMFFNPQKGKLRSIALEGVTTLQSELDYGVRLSAVADLIGDQEIRKVFTTLQDVIGDEGLPIRLQGKISSPALALDMASLKLKPADLLRGGLGKLLGDDKLRGKLGLDKVEGLDQLLEGDLGAGVGKALEGLAPGGKDGQGGVKGLLEGGVKGLLGGDKDGKKDGESSGGAKGLLEGGLKGILDSNKDPDKKSSGAKGLLQGGLKGILDSQKKDPAKKDPENTDAAKKTDARSLFNGLLGPKK